MKRVRTVGSLLLAIGLLGTLVGVAGSAAPSKLSAKGLTPDSTFTQAKSMSGALARTDPSLLGKTGTNPVNVMIKYDFDATATYAGGVSGLKATSPLTTGESLKQNDSAVDAYEDHTADVTSKISAAVEKAVPSATIRRSYQTVYGGVSATIPANSVADLLKVNGVVAVQKDSLEQPQTDVTPEFMGATAVWPSLGGSTQAGSNVVVGVLDTGIWPEHPSFANQGLPAPPGGPYACQFGDGSDVAHLGPAFSCNRKLVGAYAFTDTYLAVIGSEPGEYCNDATGVCSARDSNGHGTHTASTSAGGPVASAPIFGVNRGPISGIAPGARVIMYRVCLELGCFGSDSVAAIEQAIEDDIDVINFSISGGANPYADAVELAFLDAFNAGISVNASAGNAGPGAATADHGGPWVTTVGASTSPRRFEATINLTALNGDTASLKGSSVTLGKSSAPVVLGTAVGTNALCVNPIPANSLTNEIVVCQRGPNRVLKSRNVFLGGGDGMILYNPTKMDEMTDNHWVPTVHIDAAAGTQLLAFLSSHSGVNASWAVSTKQPRTPDVMTNFSSRGPVGDFLKPDVTAPGVQILAGNTPTPISPSGGPPGQLFQAIAGTSMSSPHSAGASAVVKAAHPDWTPAMIKSALMTSAETNVLKDDGVTPADPFDDGAGSVRINRAVNPTLVFDETTENFVDAAFDPLHRVDLNLASIDATTMTGELTTHRTAINVSGREQNLRVSVQAPPGVQILVAARGPNENGVPRSDNVIVLRRNNPTEIWVTISAPEVPVGQYFGRITLDPNGAGTNSVTIPVAFFKRQGNVTLTHTCSPTTFPKKIGAAHCLATVQNLSSTPAQTALTITSDDSRLDYSNVHAPATLIGNGRGVQWNGTLSPSLAPTINSFAPGATPFGYQPLSAFGVNPIGGLGDETITNFNVPTFYYGREAYGRLGVTSNGYIVIGGGQSQDVEFVPQDLPNVNRPNNVVAPVWTDMNPAFGGAIRIGVLTDGSTNWIVVDYAAVQNYGDATTHTYEIWIRAAGGPAGNGSASEDVSIAYGAAANAAAGDSGGVNWGAENRDGTSGKEAAAPPANGSEYQVNTSGPTPGGSATVTYDASSKYAGVYKSVATATSDVTNGKTQEVVTLTVTP